MNGAALVWAVIFGVVLVWSGIAPKDTFIWILEVAPAVIAGFVLLITRRKYPLTPLVYVLILIHCIILLVGGHYTYAEVPAGDWARDLFGGARNNYDKLGHFAQGFVPVMIAREIAIRQEIFSTPAWRNFFIVCFCLAFSAFYELIEWWVAVASGDSADAFLGAQGYVWDTQSDMFYALLGAMIALITLPRLHDRQLGKMGAA